MAIVLMLASVNRVEQAALTDELRTAGHTVHDRQHQTQDEIDNDSARNYYDALHECEYVVVCLPMTRHVEHELFRAAHMTGTAKKLYLSYEGASAPAADRLVVVDAGDRHATRAALETAVT